jgi:hypothetical protein
VRDLGGEVVADERAVNVGAARDHGGLEVIVLAVVADLGDHGTNSLVFLVVDRALGCGRREGPVGHRTAPVLAAGWTGGRGVNAGGRNEGSGLRIPAICSTATVPSIRARVARSTRNSSSSLDR